MNKAVLLIGLLQVAAVFGSALPAEDVLYKEGDRYAYIADDNLKLHLVDLWEPPVSFSARNHPVSYHLFTRQNPTSGQLLVQGNSGSVQNSNFNNNRDTKFIIHGWNGGLSSGLNSLIRNAYLNVADVNVIVVDWSSLAGGLYTTASGGTVGIGIQIGQFINFLTSSAGNNVNRVHLVGFSLGAHAAGAAGRTASGTVRRITGLDPAGPNWGPASQRLRTSDANFVEAIHTNAGVTGVGDRVAHADIYPNGGTNQPGCISGLVGSACSHSRAWEFFAETLAHNRFVGNLCASEAAARSGNGCNGATGVMGTVNMNKFLSGPFFLRTGSSSPFA